MSEFHTYLIGARREHDGANLDWVVTAENVRRAVELWRAYMIETEWLDDRTRREQTIKSVARLPGTPAGEVVWPWEQLLCDKGKYE